MKFRIHVPGTSRVPGLSAEHGSLADGASVGRSSRTWPFLILGLLLVLILPVAPAFAGGNLADFGAGGEDEGTLPAGVDPGTGILLVGTLQNLHRVVDSVSGPGELFFFELDPETPRGLFLVICHGDLLLTLDRAALATGGVDVYFCSGGQLLGGMAQANVGTQTFTPFVLEEMTYQLPLAQFFDPAESVSPAFGLFAMGPGFDRYRLSARAEGGVVEILQRSSF